MKTENQFEQDRLDKIKNDPESYIWGIFYFNRKDSRVFLPKRNSWRGWTLNFANLYTYLILISILALVLFCKIRK